MGEEFFVRALPARLDAARQALAEFVGADADGLVPVVNATTGVNAVLRDPETGRLVGVGDPRRTGHAMGLQ